MKILSLDTSVGACSAAVWVDGVTLSYCVEPQQSKQAGRLVPMIEEVMLKAGVEYTDLDRIATTVGPGSFTGIRIGLAVARAIGLASDLKLVGVSTLEVLADAANARGPALVVLNAGKGEVYAQLFESGIAMAEPQAIAIAESVNLMPAGCVLLGNAALLVADAARAVGRTATVLDRFHTPDAPWVAALASRRVAVPYVQVAPLYIRAPDAKLPAQS